MCYITEIMAIFFFVTEIMISADLPITIFINTKKIDKHGSFKKFCRFITKHLCAWKGFTVLYDHGWREGSGFYKFKKSYFFTFCRCDRGNKNRRAIAANSANDIIYLSVEAKAICGIIVAIATIEIFLSISDSVATIAAIRRPSGAKHNRNIWLKTQQNFVVQNKVL